jgi:hypothetical protein
LKRPIDKLYAFYWRRHSHDKWLAQMVRLDVGRLAKLTAPDTALKAIAYMYEKSIDDLRKKLRCHKGSSTTALANVT